jgi:hypothetical protein
MARKSKAKRFSSKKVWKAARFYCKEAQKCYKARAYFCALVARVCELEALLRVFDFAETRRRKDRCRQLNDLINRAFARHWIPHDALREWEKSEKIPLKVCLHEIREARNGVHAHLFDKDLFTRRTALLAHSNFASSARGRSSSSSAITKVLLTISYRWGSGRQRRTIASKSC